jgi:hypothetical protein
VNNFLNPFGKLAKLSNPKWQKAVNRLQDHLLKLPEEGVKITVE